MSTEEADTEKHVARRATHVDEVFTPATPIRTNDLFAGRAAQVEKMYNTMLEPGRHGVLYGERGVGKTSLANIVGERLIKTDIIVSKVSADSDDSFASLWRKVFSKIVLSSTKPGMGFLPVRKTELKRLSDRPDVDLNPDTVVETLSRLPLTVVVIDEFDRVESTRVGVLMADMIKALSDAGTGATILLVGVGSNVSDLIGHHPSVERSLRQIHLQRMAPFELEEILDNGFKRLSLEISPGLKRKMMNLSHGFPHYTHVLGKYASLYAIEHDTNTVTDDAFYSAVKVSIEDTYHSVQEYYLRVVSESDSKILPYFLLAAAVAPEDEYGAFYPRDIRKPLRAIKGWIFSMMPVRRSLNRLASEEGGNVLQRIGRPKNRRYRFHNPLMKPYIIMRAYRDGAIGEDALQKLT